MKLLSSVAALLVLGLSPGADHAPQSPTLASVRKIYITELGREEGADLVREKIRVELMKSGRFTVLEKPDGADALLTGVAGVAVSHSSNVSGNARTGLHGSGVTSYAGLGVLRLVDRRTDSTIWMFEYKRGFSVGSASSRVARKAVEKLLQDVHAAERAAREPRNKSDEQEPGKE